ncbi:ANTAR domain-containing protein [Pseudarthrobacter sp. YS3]|uniref:GAF and ANTAR domain-containing protein n=1 Tax=Pseudarthrobacter sp. YS3 TaxID=3453718 RepID=UPI003EEE9AA0
MISEQGTVRSRQRTGTGGQSGHVQPHGGIREPWIDPGPQGPEFLLDFRADSEYESLRLLASSAVAALARGAGPALDCALSVARPGLTPLTVGTTDGAASLARWDQSHGVGPVSQAMTGRLAIIANNYSRDPRWPGFQAPFSDAGYRSAVSVPLALEPGCSAALTLLAGDANRFTPAVLADVMAFSHLAGRSFRMATEIRAALTTAGQLRAAMEGRTSIDVACGVIMGQNRCSYEDAFNILARASSHRNVKARVVADTILKDLPGGPPATHFKG